MGEGEENIEKEMGREGRMKAKRWKHRQSLSCRKRSVTVT